MKKKPRAKVKTKKKPLIKRRPARNANADAQEISTRLQEISIRLRGIEGQLDFLAETITPKVSVIEGIEEDEIPDGEPESEVQHFDEDAAVKQCWQWGDETSQVEAAP